MLACNCLNVILDTESDDFSEVKPDLYLSEDEAKDAFFKQGGIQIQKVNKVTKVHAVLVETRKIGLWIIHRCLNCNMHTHAVHHQKGSVLVNSSLLKTLHIAELKRSSQFSNVFNIIVDTNMEEENSYTCLPDEQEQAVCGFKQRANSFIKKEVITMEEKIRTFTEQQHAALDEFRDRIWKEQKALTRIVINSNGNVPPSDDRTNVQMFAPASISKLAPTIVPEENITKPIISKPQRRLLSSMDGVPTHQKKLINKPASQKNSFDAEYLFELEDMDNAEFFTNSDEESSDCEDKEKEEGGIQIKVNNSGQPVNMAKSYPMNIPVFLEAYSTHGTKDPEDTTRQPEDPKDIAASIKALARSVHGDTVFGDLPRPRCSTNI